MFSNVYCNRNKLLMHTDDHKLLCFFSLTYPLRREQFQKFCTENFVNTNYLKQATLVDWTEEPENVKRLQDTALR